jgi:AbrB family looped-hinge helix DNA binding protein
METTIDRAGRVVIPKQIREAAGLKPGVALSIEYMNGRIEIERKSMRARFGSKRIGTSGQYSQRAQDVGR